ncbi:MAG TPA: hypothetical protein PKI20_09815 [Verrucomicrobiota bacterium]|jgi:hypothetical protein|nr:hypothetical protein [Verrucomicrobiota bacterium]HQL77821.1 hypothetical protein [Verrucomicrobiota bacterium]
MSGKLKKALLLLLAAVLLVGAGFVQQSLNRDRDLLGLTRVQPLENAPPVLAFTTVALGGFRGLISNALWMRATDLQDQDKFFEMAQLADWITKLEPHFVHVWLVQAWNMAYNISVKFKENSPGQFPDRWRWVKAGIELLRDDGLRFNPNETLLYRELAWFFQHKLGHNLDDASAYYKQQWADEMAKVFAKKTPNLDELINPQTADEEARTRLLRETYKMDPQFMKEVDEQYGPLEWRLPEAHAIYWAALGLKKAKENPTRFKREDLITLRRVIYQSMLLSFHRGRLVLNPFAKAFEFGPNLAILPKVNSAYEQAAEEDEENRDHIQKAHRNFLRDAVYFLYMYNRLADAARWYEYLSTRYPDKPLLDGKPNSLPASMTLDGYAVARVQEDVSDSGGQHRTQGIVEGLLVNSYRSMAVGEDGPAAGYRLLAQRVWEAYQSQMPKERLAAIGLTPFEETDREIRRRMLDPQEGEAAEVRAVLRAKLGEPPETGTLPAGTNTPPEKASPR